MRFDLKSIALRCAYAFLLLALCLLKGSSAATVQQGLVQEKDTATDTRTTMNSFPFKRDPSDHVKYLTPGCKKMGKAMAKCVGMCAGDSFEMTIDGKLALLLDEAPWSVSDLPDVRRRKLQSIIAGRRANPNLLLYTPATTVIEGPLFVQNVTVEGYFRIGNIILSPSSNMSDLQGPPG